MSAVVTRETSKITLVMSPLRYYIRSPAKESTALREQAQAEEASLCKDPVGCTYK